MTDIGGSRASAIDAVISIQDELTAWFRDEALPLWDAHGVDRANGGYFESLAASDVDGSIDASGELRRGRVVARQMYVFDAGHRMGWRSGSSSPVAHGCDYLFARLHAGDGVFHTGIDAATGAPHGAFSLYEQAFYLFALARVSGAPADGYPLAETALSCLARLRRDFGRAEGGFEESSPPTVPLKSNPHMHLLEAALAWIAVTEGGEARWLELADELVALCLTRFMDVQTGALREYFDAHWCPMAGDLGRIVEPGHQFEWAWLLSCWLRLGRGEPAVRAACKAAVERLLEIGETWGVDAARGVAINEIWDDMSVKDPHAKLWPQTERLKAWCAVLDAANDADSVGRACRRIIAAAQGMRGYLRAGTGGLWSEVLLADGSFEAGGSKASSFYHVACAIDVLRQSVSAYRTSVLYLS